MGRLLLYLPDNDSSLLLCGDVLNPAATSKVRALLLLLAAKGKNCRARVRLLFWPVLVRLQSVALHQLGDHHNHRHLKVKGVWVLWLLYTDLLLDDHVPEVFK